ncbi:hypothetical protein KW785_02180 [Candidatus Parcubacteria bacterium]|nr:hypothetical protein [Candidatus Parcubacteria bacterium]
METLIHADIFFIVTTAAVVLVTAGLIVTFIYIVRAARRLEEYADRIGHDLKETGDEVRDMAAEVRESFLFNLLFKKKRRSKDK